jgi:hypothetical protein
MSRGVVYIATGDPYYILLTAASIISLRDTGYRGPITVFSDLPALRLRSLGVHVTKITVPQGARKPSRWVKTQLAKLTPYQETLFLDADTVVHKPFTLLWNALRKHDIALGRDRNPTLGAANHATQEELQYTLRLYPRAAPQYNSGILLWRQTPAMARFFAAWHQEWARFGDIDQLALTRALAQTRSVPQEITTAAIAHLAERKKHAARMHPQLALRARKILGISALRASFWRNRHALLRFLGH